MKRNTGYYQKRAAERFVREARSNPDYSRETRRSGVTRERKQMAKKMGWSFARLKSWLVGKINE